MFFQQINKIERIVGQTEQPVAGDRSHAGDAQHRPQHDSTAHVVGVFCRYVFGVLMIFCLIYCRFRIRLKVNETHAYLLFVGTLRNLYCVFRIVCERDGAARVVLQTRRCSDVHHHQGSTRFVFVFFCFFQHGVSFQSTTPRAFHHHQR